MTSALLEALTGVSLGPADLQATFTGCVLPSPRATAGRTHAGEWASIDIESTETGQARRTATLYLRRSGAQWQLRAALREGWQIEYALGPERRASQRGEFELVAIPAEP